ncbi:transposase [Pasteuria penetrans]|uniref:transposase n=1 Tax=Pasteuria penetrans TaxID=86005 RepID=UPI000FBC06B7|nr:transposase [Pasteuria penetrans]
MKTVRKKFSLEFKQRAVEKVKNGHHIAQISRQYDIAVSTINRWVKEDRKGLLAISFSPGIALWIREVTPRIFSLGRPLRTL